jgi:LysR family transcriptional regulator, glycine cleavage system transcriptional activator
MYKRPFDLPPLHLIEGFEAAARHLSFTKAAAELFVTQSAVSRQIKALEERLGVALFERHTRALSLTPAGDTLYRTAADVLRRIDETTKRLRGHADARTFTVTTTPAFASLWLIPRLAGYTRAYPKVDVRISASAELVDLARSGVELAIRYSGPLAAGTKLFGEEVFPVCSPALMHDQARALLSPEDLKNHVLLHYEDPHRGVPMLNWAMWLQAVGLAQLEPAGALHFSHYDQVVLAAIGGQGVALGRSPLIKRFIREGRLCAPFSSKTVAARAYYIVMSKAGERNPDVKNFVGWLQAEAKKDGRSAESGK